MSQLLFNVALDYYSKQYGKDKNTKSINGNKRDYFIAEKIIRELKV